MTISVSSSFFNELETLISVSGFNLEFTQAEVGDRLDVTFDENNSVLVNSLISIISNDVDDEEEEDGSRKGRKRYMGDDIVSISERDAIKLLKADLGRKGVFYSKDRKWYVSQDAWRAFLVYKKYQTASKSKTNYRSR